MNTEKLPRVGRRTVILAALVLAGSTAFVSWWTTTLVGLPDVGDPFDVEAFARPIPDETNAFVLYKQAAALLPEREPAKSTGDWLSATLEEREWLDRCGKALEIWRRGTARPDALDLDLSTATFETVIAATKLRTFCRAALLQGSQLEAMGDFEGAFDWYHALLRSSRHCGRRGGFIERMIGTTLHNQACGRLTRWSSEPKVDARLLRLALDAAIEAGATTRPASDVFKAEYLIFLHSIADPALMAKLHDYEVVSNNQGGATTMYGQHPWKSNLVRLGRRVLDEPERSRRVAALLFANWLAYCDLPPSKRPPMVDPTWTPTTSSPARMILGNLFVTDASAPGSARALPAEKMAGWFASTYDASGVGLPTLSYVEKNLDRERTTQNSLLVSLANELYKREHGDYPEHVEDLVGPYLKTLPEGYGTKE